MKVLIDSCPAFEFLQVNIMRGPNKKMRLSDEVLSELFKEKEYSDIFERECSSDSEINVKILSCGEQSVISDEEQNVTDNSSMQHCIWVKSGAE
jgi:hypothetical protein